VVTNRKEQRKPVELPPLPRNPRGPDPLTRWADTRPKRGRRPRPGFTFKENNR
jgi:hypothetical protein